MFRIFDSVQNLDLHARFRAAAIWLTFKIADETSSIENSYKKNVIIRILQ
jgi:hypothetical protein